MNAELTAIYEVWFAEYVPLVCDLEGEWVEFPFPSESPNPEKLIILKDEFEHLSNEAKEVVGLIYNAPYTILQLLSTRKREAITIRSIENFLLESGWPRPRIKRVFKELRNFSTNL